MGGRIFGEEKRGEERIIRLMFVCLFVCLNRSQRKKEAISKDPVDLPRRGISRAEVDRRMKRGWRGGREGVMRMLL